MRIGRKSASNSQGEPNLVALLGGSADCSQCKVVDLGIRTPDAAPGNAHLEFARKVVKLRITDKLCVGFEHERRCVIEFVGVDSGERATNNIASVVTARTHCG